MDVKIHKNLDFLQLHHVKQVIGQRLSRIYEVDPVAQTKFQFNKIA